MKIRIVNICELFVGAVFVLVYILIKQYGIELKGIEFLLSLCLIILYFPLGFYTLKSDDVQVGNLIAYGLLFSIAVGAIMFSLSGNDLSFVLLFMWAGIFLIVAGYRAFFVYFFNNYKRILEYSNLIAIRYLILFIVMIGALVTYHFHW